jgi:hypothetical protein
MYQGNSSDVDCRGTAHRASKAPMTAGRPVKIMSHHDLNWQNKFFPVNKIFRPYTRPRPEISGRNPPRVCPESPPQAPNSGSLCLISGGREMTASGSAVNSKWAKSSPGPVFFAQFFGRIVIHRLSLNGRDLCIRSPHFRRFIHSLCEWSAVPPAATFDWRGRRFRSGRVARCARWRRTRGSLCRRRAGRTS